MNNFFYIHHWNSPAFGAKDELYTARSHPNFEMAYLIFDIFFLNGKIFWEFIHLSPLFFQTATSLTFSSGCLFKSCWKILFFYQILTHLNLAGQNGIDILINELGSPLTCGFQNRGMALRMFVPLCNHCSTAFFLSFVFIKIDGHEEVDGHCRFFGQYTNCLDVNVISSLMPARCGY